ncbi:hypothetical protein CKQ69_29935 [Bacillus toyonensis]|nr:hypothetical protein CKQ69_29935 [Bacillus toyonensis]
MIKLDRTAVDKAITEMKLFEATKEVLASYEAEKEVLKKREEALTERLAHYKNNILKLYDREVANDNPSDYIYLSSQLSKLESDMKVLLPLKEALQEEYTLLKQKYMPIIRETYSKDSATRNKHFNVSEAVSYVREELKLVISDYEKLLANKTNR